MDDLENIDMYCSVTNCPIKEFIKELTAKHQYQEVAQIIHHIKLLNDYGYELKKHFPKSTKHIVDDIYELRMKTKNNINRVFYFFYNNNKYILLHGFTKKTQETPINEINKAKKEKNEYIKYARRNENEYK